MNNFPDSLLKCNNYEIEIEQAKEKRRTGIYLRKDVAYTRRFDLESNDCHIVIVDIIADKKVRIINMYRSFHPPGGVPVGDFFKKQLQIVKNAICDNCIVMGDFNLDDGPDLRPDYSNKIMLDSLKLFANELNLIQVVDFNTWSRTINGTKKESLLDHVYLNRVEMLDAVYFDTPLFGDHVLVILDLLIGTTDQVKSTTKKRDWRKYTSSNITNTLSNMLCEIDLNNANDVQTCWNLIENVIITTTDHLAPLVEDKSGIFNNKNVKRIPPTVKNKMNKRSRYRRAGGLCQEILR